MSYIDLCIEAIKNINFLSVLVATAANFFLGALWYSQVMFAKPWSKIIFGDIPIEEARKKAGNVGMLMGLAFIMTFITAVGFAVVMHNIPDAIMTKQRVYFAIGFAGLISIFINAANLYKHYLFELKPFKLAVINSLHDWVAFTIMTVIMAYWN